MNKSCVLKTQIFPSVNRISVFLPYKNDYVPVKEIPLSVCWPGLRKLWDLPSIDCVSKVWIKVSTGRCPHKEAIKFRNVDGELFCQDQSYALYDDEWEALGALLENPKLYYPHLWITIYYKEV